MIYTLIMTIVFASIGTAAGPRQIVHVEHDYESSSACHAAYDIARRQADQLLPSGTESAGTCLSHPGAKS